MELKGSKTEKNLLAAFAGESQARNRYTFLPVRRKRKATSRFLRSFWKRQKTRRNMPNSSLICSKGEIPKSWLLILPESLGRPPTT